MLPPYRVSPQYVIVAIAQITYRQYGWIARSKGLSSRIAVVGAILGREFGREKWREFGGDFRFDITPAQHGENSLRRVSPLQRPRLINTARYDIKVIAEWNSPLRGSLTHLTNLVKCILCEAGYILWSCEMKCPICGGQELRTYP